MRWLIVSATLLIAGVTEVTLAPVRSMFRDREGRELPALRVTRSTLTQSAVAIGTIKPKVGAEVKVGSQLSGVVAELKVSVGDKVRRGDLLASLKDSDWRARVDVLRAQLASAIAEKEYAEGELARAERLRDVVPSIEIESARKTLRVRQAEVQRVRAGLAEAEILLGYTVIRAPVSGTIGSVSTYEGETVAASMAAPTFVTIVDLDRLEVQTYVDETDIGKVRVGQPVTLRVDSFPGRELRGVVQAIYPKAQLINNVVNYVVIVDIVDAHGLLIRPEMTAHVSFILEEKPNVVNIPRNALLREGGRELVVVKNGDEWVERAVKTGLQTPQRIEIVSGLREGDVIVADKQAWKETREDKP